jgi:hypothetical protein
VGNYVVHVDFGDWRHVKALPSALEEAQSGLHCIEAAARHQFDWRPATKRGRSVWTAEPGSRIAIRCMEDTKYLIDAERYRDPRKGVDVQGELGVVQGGLNPGAVVGGCHLEHALALGGCKAPGVTDVYEGAHAGPTHAATPGIGCMVVDPAHVVVQFFAATEFGIVSLLVVSLTLRDHPLEVLAILRAFVRVITVRLLIQVAEAKAWQAGSQINDGVVALQVLW